MPVERAAGQLPRWITKPQASDFAGPELLAWETTSGEQGDGLASWSCPHHRFMHALDLYFGYDDWDRELAKYPAWPGGWTPGKAWDPAAYERLPGGPPDDLRQAVDAWQAGEDEKMRERIRRNSFPEHVADMMERVGVPPGPLAGL